MTFVTARMLVFMIMDHLIPDLYLHVDGTHVHHLNYGIFLLSGVGGYLLVMRPTGIQHDICTFLYAIGLALTFDEFGMWLHLGGPYWQRASFDAVIVISALLGFLAFTPHISTWSARRWQFMVLLAVAMALFSFLFAKSLRHAKEKITWKLQSLEARQPK